LQVQLQQQQREEEDKIRKASDAAVMRMWKEAFVPEELRRQAKDMPVHAIRKMLIEVKKETNTMTSPDAMEAESIAKFVPRQYVKPAQDLWAKRRLLPLPDAVLAAERAGSEYDVKRTVNQTAWFATKPYDNGCGGGGLTSPFDVLQGCAIKITR
jgi:hypothetical protein